MPLSLPRAKKKERFDSDFDFAAEKISSCVLIFIGVEIEIPIGIVALDFFISCRFPRQRCLSAAGGGRFYERLMSQAFHFARSSSSLHKPSLSRFSPFFNGLLFPWSGYVFGLSGFPGERREVVM